MAPGLGSSERSICRSGFQRSDLINAFAHCVYASSIVMRMPSFGGLPSTVLASSSSGSSTTVARPLTRNVSPMPGIRKSRPMRSSSKRLVSVSAIRLPGRSGISSVRSSRIRTKPAGSPRGETSSPPSGRAVATQTNGERSMNCWVRSFSRSAIFATTRSVGVPMTSRRAASSRIEPSAAICRG